jgi:hypothetical protein
MSGNCATMRISRAAWALGLRGLAFYLKGAQGEPAFALRLKGIKAFYQLCKNIAFLGHGVQSALVAHL